MTTAHTLVGSAAAATTAHREALYRDGVVALPGCFPPQWADRLDRDFDAAFAEASERPEGLIGRGPHRYYFAVHPEQISGFVDLITHPTVTALCREMLGPDYLFVELGFDVPWPGATTQPWHRDFPTPDATAQQGRLTSLAFNLTTVDVTPDLAPFEIAPGTQFDDGSAFDHGMFPPTQVYPRYDGLASRRYPHRGDVSARSALTLHRGTEHLGDQRRPVLILGAVTGDTDPADTDIHDLFVTEQFHSRLPESVQKRLRCTVVDQLTPITQRHDIEGLVMG